jgi:hypothetical protein
MLSLPRPLHTRRNTRSTPFNALPHILDSVSDRLARFACHPIDCLAKSAPDCADHAADCVGYAGDAVPRG